ncbi:hypothetical protein PACTADRAFT_3477 [Pachysolen tannophilus NRRL Y-2460]|uniref:Uncharacterized protein n=1 Tax=Pachysolen tannophilus NRRL Y-2460 TaxID=669874 RepID=A0A1E4TS54_PACTA|nr:hypothetical protein PACTADRAFT_3477 [Pachysolen tannophilus NRRL Y-2460]
MESIPDSGYKTVDRYFKNFLYSDVRAIFHQQLNLIQEYHRVSSVMVVNEAAVIDNVQDFSQEQRINLDYLPSEILQRICFFLYLFKDYSSIINFMASSSKIYVANLPLLYKLISLNICSNEIGEISACSTLLMLSQNPNISLNIRKANLNMIRPFLNKNNKNLFRSNFFYKFRIHLTKITLPSFNNLIILKIQVNDALGLISTLYHLPNSLKYLRIDIKNYKSRKFYRDFAKLKDSCYIKDFKCTNLQYFTIVSLNKSFIQRHISSNIKNYFEDYNLRSLENFQTFVEQHATLSFYKNYFNHNTQEINENSIPMKIKFTNELLKFLKCSKSTLLQIEAYNFDFSILLRQHNNDCDFNFPQLRLLIIDNVSIPKLINWFNFFIKDNLKPRTFVKKIPPKNENNHLARNELDISNITWMFYEKKESSDGKSYKLKVPINIFINDLNGKGLFYTNSKKIQNLNITGQEIESLQIWALTTDKILGLEKIKLLKKWLNLEL